MKLHKLALAPVAAAVMALSAPAVANTLTWQGVTFATQAVDSDTMTLSITGATAATGDWTGINFLKAFEIKDIGNVTGASILPANFTAIDLNLANKACVGPAGSGGMCFSATPPVALTSSMSWTIDFVGTGLHFDNPHLKVNFLKSAGDTKATGDLLSQNITAVPEPETYAMLLAGLGLMGFVARRRKRQAA